VHGLPNEYTDADLRALVAGHGEVVSARVSLDRESGRPRDFGFVTFARKEMAAAAIAELAGLVMPHGRRLKMEFSASESARR
jgi:RNA recognition motif-containing protein